MLQRLMFFLSIALFAPNSYAHEPSLREKIGQMLIVGFEGKVIDPSSSVARYIREDNIGGVILFDYNTKTKTFAKNIESPEQVRTLNQQLQQLNASANKKYHRPPTPLLITVDYEGGRVNRLHPRYGFPLIPSPKEVSKKGIDEAYYQSERMTQVLVSTGFNLNFFPLLDVDVNPENPIIGKLERSFSADPNVVTQYAQLYGDNLLDNHIECAYKHFPGHGSSKTDSHLGFVDITTTWTSAELIPYVHILSQPKHCGVVMVAHVVNHRIDPSGLPATLSYPMISGMLRHDLQFDGVVITDDMQMKAIADYYGLAHALTLAINAGADMLIFGNQLVENEQDPKELVAIIESQVQHGEIARARIDEAYARIIKLKKSLKP